MGWWLGIKGDWSLDFNFMGNIPMLGMRMKCGRVGSVLLLVLSLFLSGTTFAVEHDKMRAAVAKLVEAAQKRTTLWPWKEPVPEVAIVAAYGKPVAPLLVNLLADDPDGLGENAPEVDWNVQQQAALALCRIYRVREESGHVYMNRASRKENASVKRFWLEKVSPPRVQR